MKEDGANVIEVAIQGEKASPCLVRPNLDFVVVAARHKKRLRFVKVDTTYRPIVLFESIDQSAHAVIPELNGG